MHGGGRDNAGSSGVDGRRLDSWKEIASYLGKGVTTVQRWEQEEGLPVRRHAHAKKGSVFAFQNELDAWRLGRSRLGGPPPPDPAVGEQPEKAQHPPSSAGASTVHGSPYVAIAVAMVGVVFATGLLVQWPRAAVPEAPANLVTSTPRPGTAVLTWSDRSTTETGFEVRRFDKTVATVGPNISTTEFTGLDAGTSYHWDVRACNASGCSGWHGVVGRTPDGSGGLDGRPWAEQAGIVFTSDRIGRHGTLWSIEPSGAAPRQITNEHGTLTMPALSPDRRRIAFVGDQSGYNAIYVMDIGSSKVRKLTHSEPAHATVPCWSPDGERLAFTSLASGDSEIWVMNADGSRPVNLTRHTAMDSYPAWSRDGRHLAFVSDRNGSEQIYLMRSNGSGVRQLTNSGFENRFPAWSPDDRWIAFSGISGEKSDVLAMAVDGSWIVNVTSHPAIDEAPKWSPDGTRILFTTMRDGNSELYSMNRDGSDPRNLTSTVSADYYADWGFPLTSARITSSLLRMLRPPGWS